MKYIEGRKQKTKAFERELNFIGLQEVQTKYSLILMGESVVKSLKNAFCFHAESSLTLKSISRR